MASSSNKKLLLFYILKVLQEYSDENHALTQNEIICKIYSMYGMTAERKAISVNIDCLIDLDYDIVKLPKGGYFLAQRDFEPSEITYLVDVIFSSRAISGVRAKTLAAKLSSFLSKYKRQNFKYIYKTEDINRTSNKQIFYTIEILNEAIEQNKQVSFYYLKYNEKGDLVSRKEKPYIINPYFLVNNKGQYYLVCNLDKYDDTANYKLEFIKDIKILDTQIKPQTELAGRENKIDITKYINENIYMFGDKVVTAQIKILNCQNGISIVKEWFGENSIIDTKEGETYAKVTANEQALIYWCLQYGDLVTLLSPTDTKEKITRQIENMRKNYS